MLRIVSILSFLAVAQIPTISYGEKAGPVEPSKWLNNRGTVSWNSLKGRLILVEKWVTY